MYYEECEKKLLKQTYSAPPPSTPPRPPVVDNSNNYSMPSPTTPIFYSPTKTSNNYNSFDRFIPTRLGNNWQTTFSMISEGNRGGFVNKKSRENNGEGSRDGIAYSCLLRNELLGTYIFIFFFNFLDTKI